MYFAHNEGKSTIKYNYNKIYQHSIGKKPIDADHPALTEKIKTNLKTPKFEVDNRVRITKYKHISKRGYSKNWSKEIFVTDTMLKTNLQIYKFKCLN